MKQYTFLIPILRNSDREKHHVDTWKELESFLLSFFGGYSCPNCAIKGKWFDPESGEVIEDSSGEFRVSCDDEKPLFAILRDSCAAFDQK